MKSIYDSEYRSIIDALITCRKNQGITQSQLAEKLNVDQSIISKIETSVRRIDVVELQKVCQAINITLSEILPPHYLKSAKANPTPVE